MIIALNIYNMSVNNTEESIHLNESREIDSCLVMCFEERDDPENFDSVDTRVFVTYDADSDTYIINGKRVDVFSRRGRNKTKFQPFMFCVNASDDVANFIFTIFDKDSKMSYTLYNYNNLPEDACSMTYEFMESNMDKRYEIAAYDNSHVKKSLIRKLVRMSRLVYN